MKKIILLFIAIITTLLIYKYNYHENKKILIIGDGIALGINNHKITYNFTDELKKEYPNHPITTYTKANYRIKDLTSDIQNNTIINNTPLQSTIKKSNHIILFLGTEEILNQLSNQTKETEIISSIITDYQTLIQQLTKYNTHITIINYYSIPTINTKTLNHQLKSLTQNKNISILDISTLKAESTTYHLSASSHLQLYKILTTYLKSKNLI